MNLAIVQALLTKVGSETFAVPLTNILETIKISSETIRNIEHHPVVTYRETVLPLIYLRERFGFSKNAERSTLNANGNRIPIVVVESGHRKAGLAVDELLTQQEVLIKENIGRLKGVKGISGATILGDGRVAMILDVGSLV